MKSNPIPNETNDSLLAKVQMARALGDDYVETDRAAIERFCGINYAQHCFDFMGIKVWERGFVPENGEELPITTEQYLRNQTEAYNKK